MAMHRVRLVGICQRLQFLFVQLDVQCSNRFLEVLHLACPDDWRGDARCANTQAKATGELDTSLCFFATQWWFDQDNRSRHFAGLRELWKTQ